jgi:hypothetical protein
MKFIFTAEINVPVEKTFELFINKGHLKEWQKELMGYEHVNGIPGAVGAVTKLNYKTVTIIETITFINKPNEIKGIYDHKRGEKTVMIHNSSNRFSPIGGNKTLFELEMQDVKFVGWLPKLLSKLMGKMFEKYHQNEVNQFKVFAEKTG